MLLTCLPNAFLMDDLSYVLANFSFPTEKKLLSPRWKKWAFFGDPRRAWNRGSACTQTFLLQFEVGTTTSWRGFANCCTLIKVIRPDGRVSWCEYGSSNNSKYTIVFCSTIVQRNNQSKRPNQTGAEEKRMPHASPSHKCCWSFHVSSGLLELWLKDKNSQVGIPIGGNLSGTRSWRRLVLCGSDIIATFSMIHR